ncbi:Rha family transcriptional regulator [Methanobrevibacter sp. UBA46]|uniref:Rha family transcriptional regulator n=1 Tax=Methanobrevibacter sp. UBA46 TaxID=1915488 RepID=UPI0039B9B9F7
MENKLLKMVDGIPTANSKDIAEHFGKQHAEVIYAIEGRQDLSGKIKNNGLIPQLIEDGISQVEKYFIKTTYIMRGKEYPQYELTRDGFSLLVMGFTGKKALEWKLKYIAAFNEMECEIQKINSKAKLLMAIYNGGQDAVVASKQLTELEKKPLLDQIEEQKPMVEFATTVTKSCDNILMRDMAKLLCDQKINIGEKRLYKLLRSNGVLMDDNTPYQSYVDRGYFYIKENTFNTPYGQKLNKTTLVTPKGQIWIVGKAKEWLGMTDG